MKTQERIQVKQVKESINKINIMKAKKKPQKERKILTWKNDGAF